MVKTPNRMPAWRAQIHVDDTRGVTVCHAVTCRTCWKTTWSGCGLHVDQALAGVPQDDRCPGHPAADGRPGGALSRFLGRR